MRSIPYIDRSFAVAVVVFLLGIGVGYLLLLSLRPLQLLMMGLLSVRMISPIESANQAGAAYVWLLVMANNSVPVILSFLYIFILVRVNWTPPLSVERKLGLLYGYSCLCSFLVGFFGFGSVLAMGWVLGGTRLLTSLLLESWVHGPIEVAGVLLSVSEPMRLAAGLRKGVVDIRKGLRADLPLLAVCLLLLSIAAAIEVYVRL
ncbi:MAG TPA: hypothetical protein VLV18_02325 [Terriglobales bacterium]|nr:hypothetical protein [Terriglobales bacterium]